MTQVFPEVEVLVSVQVDTAYNQHGLQVMAPLNCVLIPTK